MRRNYSKIVASYQQNIGQRYVPLFLSVLKVKHVLGFYDNDRFLLWLDTGKAWFSKNWNLCSALHTEEDTDILKQWLTDVWTNIAMVNYPYAADFLAPLPAYPIKVYLITKDN